VQFGAVGADIPQERHGLGCHLRGLRDEIDDLLHLRPQFAKLIEVDRSRRGEHLVDGIVIDHA
jgi:hypothetical protein